MKIGELAQRTGCPVTRIRFYEQKGLLPEPRRSMGGQRNYSQEAVKRLEFITTCRANGMKLECIERFIEFEQDPSKGTEWLLERVDEYLEQAKVYREQLDERKSIFDTYVNSFPSLYWQKRRTNTRVPLTRKRTRVRPSRKLKRSKFFDKESTNCIQDSKNHDSHVSKNCHPHVGQANSSQQKTQDLDADSQPDVFLDNAKTFTRNLDAFGNF